MPDLQDRIQLYFGQKGLGCCPVSLQRILAPVLRHGTSTELLELGRVLLGQPAPEAALAGLEAIDRSEPGHRSRPDDDLPTIERRARLYAGCFVRSQVLGAAYEGVSEALRGDLLLASFGSAAHVEPRLLLDELEGGTPWSGFVGRLLLAFTTGTCSGFESGQDVLERILISSLDSWENHRQPEVLLAAVVMAARSRDRFARELAAREGPGLSALKRAVRESSDPLVRSNLVALVGVRGLSEAAVGALEQLRLSQIDSVLAQGGHLLRSPRRHRRLIRSRMPARVSGRLGQRRPLEAGAARAVTRLLSGNDAHGDQYMNRLVELASHPDPLAGVLASAQLLDRPAGPRREAALDSIRTHSNNPLAVRLASLVATSGDAGRASRSIEAFERSLEARPGWWCASCALAHLESDPKQILSVLERVLEHGSDRAFETALEVIHRRRLVPDLERALVELVQTDDSRRAPPLLARVIRLLAMGPTDRSARVIIRSLASHHALLQAAALDAATDRKASPAVRAGCSLVDVALLERLSSSPEEAVRQGALRALRVRSGSRARDMVQRLLVATTPELRLTALDAIHSGGDPELRSSVLRLMEREDVPNIITRGRSVLAFLESRARISSLVTPSEVEA